jgi:quinoprotein dehydrogenase-associated probable ABC transporter substrate-binding protein/PQQ-dependent catabolism-associated CXXCW motif protein
LSIELIDPKVLRVCADPRNMPFSTENGEGFENRIAELFATKLGKSLAYTWYPGATGFVRNTLGAYKCDVIMGEPQGSDIVQVTNPYYRTAYALVIKPGSGLDGIDGLSDPRLKDKHIGIVAGTPPGTYMALNGLMTNAKPYPLVIDTRVDSSAAAMMQDLAQGTIDAGILWGPMAGWYAGQAKPPMTVVPLVKEKAGPRLAYYIGMGVRGADQDWKRQDIVELRRPAARRQGPAARAGRAVEVVMSISSARRVVMALVALACMSAWTQAGEPPVEPATYRTDDYRAPTPATLAGARVVTTQEAATIWQAGGAAFVDVLPRAPRPANLPAGTLWREKTHSNIPGSLWLADTGYGELAPVTEQYFRAGLQQITGGDRAKLLVIYCLRDCWMSWNAAKRAVSLGYTNVVWYPDGTDGWQEVGLTLAEATPAPRPEP